MQPAFSALYSKYWIARMAATEATMGKQGIEQRGTRVLPLHVLQRSGVLAYEHEQRGGGDHHAYAAAHVIGAGIHQLQAAASGKAPENAAPQRRGRPSISRMQASCGLVPACHNLRDPRTTRRRKYLKRRPRRYPQDGSRFISSGVAVCRPPGASVPRGCRRCAR